MSSFGPGPMTPAVRAIVIANVAMFVVGLVAPAQVVSAFGLLPRDVIERGRVWQLATFLFVHPPGSFMTLLFNMLSVWMFGVDLERRWGTIGFLKFYAVAGIGAGACVTALSLLPFDSTHAIFVAGRTVGAAGAVYGLLMAWALLFPYRQILFMLIFPLQAWVAACLMGAIAFFSAFNSGSPVANIALLGGVAFGWIYLKGPKDLELTFKYHLTRWRMERMRRRFNVHKGGRNDDWQNRLH
jgi:membrane associated rhomboid family serine protease